MNTVILETQKPVSNTAIKTKTETKASAFKEVLANTVNKEESEKSISETKDTEEASVSKMEELLPLLDRLFEGLPNESAFLSEMMKTNDASKLINLLPPSVKDEVLQLLQSGKSLEELVQFSTSTSKAAQLTTSLIALNWLESKNLLPQNEGASGLVKLLNNELQKQLNITLPDTDIADYGNIMKQILAVLSNNETNVNQQVNNKLLPFRERIVSKVKNESTNGLHVTTDVKSASIKQQGDVIVSKELMDRIQELAQEVDTDNSKTLNKSTFELQAPLNKLQQYVIHLSQAKQSEGQTNVQQQFLEQFQQIMKQSKLLTGANGNTQLTIRLKPDHLGSLSVKILEINGEMVARIAVSSKMAKDLVESNLHQLKTMFSTQNIQIEKLDVLLQSNPNSEENFKDQGKNQQQSNESFKDNKETEDDGSDLKSFKEEFEEKLLNVSV